MTKLLTLPVPGADWAADARAYTAEPKLLK